MSQQGPVMRQQEKSGMPGWLMGCGIGCGVLIIAIIVGVVLVGGLGYFAMKKVMEEGKGEVVAELNTQYDTYIENGAIPAEHRPLYDELRDLAVSDASSFPAVLMCFVAIQASFEDGEVTEQEVQIATEVRDFVKKDPQVGWIGMGTFFAEHPEFEQAFNEAQRKFGGSAASDMTGDESQEPIEEKPIPDGRPMEIPEAPVGVEP